MELASIPGFVRTILIIVLVYYIVKYALRLFMNLSAKSSAGAGSFSSNRARKEGDVTIEYLRKPEKKGSSTSDDADQVDFEEIED